MPKIMGIERFRGRVVHIGVYKSSSDFRNQSVLVIGCGNFGMEVSLEVGTVQIGLKKGLQLAWLCY